ncbi:MAG: hypothetical protein P8N92_04510, partial [Burkholderiales bacterium]|nr:hypothetical protein [Burkholderiales bacterium]
MTNFVMCVQRVWLRLHNSILVHGFIGTLYRLFRYPVTLVRLNGLRKRIFKSADVVSVFAEIYETNWWGSSESVSGTGSTLSSTANLRSQLPKVFETIAAQKIFDAPCGDFNWMRHVVQSCDIDYIGGDIVPRLIRNNIEMYQADRTRFTLTNLIKDDFPKADLWICRDCLIHFSYDDILATFENFARSEIDYLLTTTHINSNKFRNMNICTGDARMIDLFSEPFFLPKNYFVSIDDWQAPEPPRIMVL